MGYYIKMVGYKTIRRALAAAAACVTAAGAPLYAAHPDAGTAAFPFLTMNYDARTVAMAGAAAAVPNGIYGVLTNPAAVGFAADRGRVAAGYRQVFMDIWGGPFMGAFPIKGGALSISLLTQSMGAFDIVDENNDLTGGRAKSGYTAFGVGYSKVIYDNLSAGGVVKGLYHGMEAGDESYSASGVAADLGVQYRLSGGRIIYGLALRNLGVMISGYTDEFDEYPMPITVEAGVSYIPRHILPLRIALDVSKTRGDYLNFEPALEYSVIANTLFLRGGYTFSYMDLENAMKIFGGDRDDAYRKSSINTLSLGVGAATVMDGVDISLDAAAQFHTEVSNPVIAISVSVGF